MGTTRTTTATTTTTPTTTPTIIFTEDELNPYAAHAPKHRRPATTGPALPQRPPHDALSTYPGGEIPATSLPHDHPGLPASLPLAPGLEELVRLATAVDELAALRGQFTAYASRLGPRAVAEARRGLLAVFEPDETGPEHTRYATPVMPGASVMPGLLRQLAAVIRPLAPATGPCTASGLALDLPARFLGEESGPGAVVRFDDVDCPQALTHAPTRRFLRERGLPEKAARFSVETDAPLRTLAEHAADSQADGHGDGDALAGQRLPAGADRLIRLGGLTADTAIVLDGATGAVLVRSERDLGLRPLNADISTLALTLRLTRHEHALTAVHALTATYDRLADTMCRTLSDSAHPTPCTLPSDGATAHPGPPA
ncbi:SUKH-4 family immunity protein [Streptomyces sp. NBC_00704]|uniref:SUKH-4 family immunity protein n=1 Tax=Streptomyces sp. NBC_00704 TaxID=2975809 RepID=UPI002E37192C|nr:SUKH-4 family immunity protein [Streptomyces sp. NBC_00704]